MSDLLKIAFDRANALQVYWGFYGTTVAAILAFFGTSQRHWSIGLAFTAAFVAAALANLEALRDVTRQRLALQEKLLASDDETELAIAKTIRPATLKRVTISHLAADVLVVVAIWALVRYGPNGLIAN